MHPSQSNPNLQFTVSQPKDHPGRYIHITSVLCLTAVTPVVPLLPDDQRCKYPRCNKKRYQEGDKTHDFCGRFHAREYQKLKGHILIGMSIYIHMQGVKVNEPSQVLSLCQLG